MRLVDKAVAAVSAGLEQAGAGDFPERRRRLAIVGSPDTIRRLRQADGVRSLWSDPIAGADAREVGRFAGVPVLDIGVAADPESLSVLLGSQIVSTIPTLNTISGPLFYMACRGLYGVDFHKAARQAFNVEDRTLRDWISGRRPIPDGVALELAQALAIKVNELQTLLAGVRGG